MPDSEQSTTPGTCPAHGAAGCAPGECPDYMARWLLGACSSGDPLRNALTLVVGEFQRRTIELREREAAARQVLGFLDGSGRSVTKVYRDRIRAALGGAR